MECCDAAEKEFIVACCRDSKCSSSLSLSCRRVLFEIYVKRLYETGATNNRSVKCLTLEQATNAENSFFPMSIIALFKVKP